MFVNNSPEYKTLLTSYQTVSQTLQNTDYISTFLKQYSEATKIYIDKLKFITDKLKQKYINSLNETNNNNNHSHNNNSDKDSLFSSALINNIINIFELKLNCFSKITEIENSQKQLNTHLDIHNEKLRSFKEQFQFIQNILMEKYKEVDKRKKTLFKEANNLEDLLIKRKRKLNKRFSFTFGDKKKNLLQGNNETTKQKNIKVINEVKGCKIQYMRSIRDYNTFVSEFRKKSLEYNTLFININNESNQQLLQCINKLYIFFRIKDTILTPEINDFFSIYKKRIDNELIEQQIITNDTIDDNPLYELKEEKYKLKLLDNSQQITREYKIQFSDKDIQEIVRSFSDILSIKESDMLILNINKSEEFEVLINKLISKEYILFPLIKEEKTILYECLKENKYRYLFYSKMEELFTNPKEEFIDKQIHVFLKIFSFILNESFKDKDYYMIYKLFMLFSTLNKLIKVKQPQKNIFYSFRNHPLVNKTEFWTEFLNIIITEELIDLSSLDLTKENQTILSKLKFCVDIMKKIKVNKEIIINALVLNICKFNLDNVFEELCAFIK